jgi:hypothetical protein
VQDTVNICALAARAQYNRVTNGLTPSVDVRALKVAAVSAALARDALGDRVEGAKVAHDLFEGGEQVRGACVQVRLVDFVGEEDEVVLGAENELLNCCLVEQCAHRVARVAAASISGADVTQPASSSRW